MFESNIIRNQDDNPYCESCSDGSTLVYAGYDFNNDYNSFTNNLFENGNYGFHYYNSKGSIINKNIFKNQIIASVYVLNQDSITINNNIISSISNYYDFYAIYGSVCTNYLGIEKNKIFVPNASNGIILEDCSGTDSKYGSITNNFVTVNGRNSESGLNGISLTWCGYINIIYNSIYINSPNQSSSKALNINYGNQINLKNSNRSVKPEQYGSGFLYYKINL